MLKPYKILNNQELGSLVLISKSKNEPYKPIYKEELPIILYNKAPRSILGKTWFNNYTSHLDKVVNCQGCGKALGSRGERHESYGLYSINFNGGIEYLIKLENVIKLCGKCHKTVHNKFSTKLGVRYGFIPNQAPESKALSIGPWDKAKYLLIDNNLYLFK